MFKLILAFAASYILGSVSFANLAGKIKGIELSREGSGTLGARNVKRIIGKWPAAAVLILDILKGAAAVVIAINISENDLSPMIGWLGVICGHGRSIFLKFKGGKGLASSVGALALISPVTLVIELLIGTFLIVFFRHIYLAAMIMVVSLPFIIHLTMGQHSFTVASIAVCAVILYFHKVNLEEVIQFLRAKKG